jgi:hypothetical protein
MGTGAGGGCFVPSSVVMDERLLGPIDERIERFTYGSVTDWLVEQSEHDVDMIENMLARTNIEDATTAKLRELADDARVFLERQKAKQAYLAANPDLANLRIE